MVLVKRKNVYGALSYLMINKKYGKKVVIEADEMLSAFGKLSDEKQKNILDAAASIFAEEGYHYASISRICNKSGISNGALYKYFKNKESLFLTVLNYGADLAESELYIKYTNNVTSVFEAVRDLLKGLVQFTKEKRDYISIYSDLGSCSMNRFAAVAADKYKNSTSLYTMRLVENGKSKGEICEGISSNLASCLIDNYITLFSYSLVSEYHVNRFDSFFNINGKELNEDERIELIIKSLKMALT